MGFHHRRKRHQVVLDELVFQLKQVNKTGSFIAVGCKQQLNDRFAFLLLVKPVFDPPVFQVGIKPVQ